MRAMCIIILRLLFFFFFDPARLGFVVYMCSSTQYKTAYNSTVKFHILVTYNIRMTMTYKAEFPCRKLHVFDKWYSKQCALVVTGTIENIFTLAITGTVKNIIFTETRIDMRLVDVWGPVTVSPVHCTCRVSIASLLFILVVSPRYNQRSYIPSS